MVAPDRHIGEAEGLSDDETVEMMPLRKAAAAWAR